MGVSYTANMSVTCTLQAEYDKILADAQADPNVSNLVTDLAHLKLTFTITVTE